MTALKDLRSRARGGWLAVVLTGLVLLGSVPFYADVLPRGFGSDQPLELGQPGFYVVSSQGRMGRLAGHGSGALGPYWVVAVPLAYVLLAGWFAARARHTGLQQRWGLYVGVGLGVFGLLLLSVLPATDPLSPTVRSLTTPLLLISMSLLVLAVVEHDRRVGALAAVASAVAAYVGVFREQPFVVPSSWPGEPVLSAAASPQGAVTVLGVVLLVSGLFWRTRLDR